MCDTDQCQPGVCLGGQCSSRTPPKFEIGNSKVTATSTYKYVGPGRGEFSLRDEEAEQRWSIRLILGRCALLCMVVLLAPLLWLLHQMLTVKSSATVYDCTDGYENWMQKWTAAKRSWCCEHRSRGCFVPHGGLQPQSGKPRGMAVTFATSPTPKTTASVFSTIDDAYDCISGFAHWERLWKPSKRSWCCKRVQRGCSTTVSRWPPTLNPTSYACSVDLIAVPGAWTADERVWCCEHRGRGCPTAPPTTPDSTTTTTATSSSTTSQTTTPPYNCGDNPFSGVRDWSDSQKVWCCEHQARGCPTPLPSTTTPLPITVPPPAPYNCSGAPRDWTVRWSIEKKRWCCEYRACPTKV